MSPQGTFLAAPHVWPQGAELRRVVGELVGCRSPFRYISTETTGIGAVPSQELRRRVTAARPRMLTSWAMIATTAPLKLAAYSLARCLLERGQLVLPREPALLRQARGTAARPVADRSADRCGGPAVRDDVADALAFCSLPYRARRGRIVCGLADLADPARAGALRAPGGSQSYAAAARSAWRRTRPATRSGRAAAALRRRGGRGERIERIERIERELPLTERQPVGARGRGHFAHLLGRGRVRRWRPVRKARASGAQSGAQRP